MKGSKYILIMRLLILAILLVMSVITGWAQAVYPSRVVVFLNPPYSLYLDDYVSGMRERMLVTLYCDDKNRPSLTIKLRITIKAQGFTLTTLPYAVFQPIIVESGFSYRLSAQELAPYFNWQNLSPSGIGGSAWQKERKLPEGMVQFCFEILDYATGRLLSAPGCGMAWISAKKPPTLNQP